MRSFDVVICTACNTKEMRVKTDKTKGCKACGNPFVIRESHKVKPVNDIPKTIIQVFGNIILSYKYSKKEFKSIVAKLNGYSTILYSGYRHDGNFKENPFTIDYTLICANIIEW